MSCFIKFKNYLRGEIVAKALSVADLNYAEKSIFKYEQTKVFDTEYNCISNNKNLPRNSKIKNLSPVLYDDVLRVGGRIHLSNLSEDMKHPIILPNDSPVSKCYLLHVHNTGRESMLAHLRKNII